MPNLLAVILLIAALATANTAGSEGDRFTRFAGFELGRVALGDVQKTLGPSPLREAGDGGEYEAWVCYSLPAGQVEFNSGEMGGNTHDLLGFTISRHGRNRHCPDWPGTIPAPAMQLGDVPLGISTEAFEVALKAPVEWRGNLGTCHYDYRREPTHAEILALPAELRAQAESNPAQFMLDVLITVEGTFDHGRLVTLTAWKIESY
jgi:hypothetical protein